MASTLCDEFRRLRMRLAPNLGVARRLAGFGVPALLLVFGGRAQAAGGVAGDPCPRSASLDVGPTDGPFYATVAPFEHDQSERTQVFPFACSLGDLGRNGIQGRKSAVNFADPYIPFTRGRDELFVYGYGLDAATQGAFVASVDPATLRQRWRTQILADELPDQWSYPGVGLAHGNGFIYAIYANVIVKLDARSGATLLRRQLPEDPDGTGAAYNGMIVMPDGRIVAKGMERGPCPSLPAGSSAYTEAFEGLVCGVRNDLPSTIVTLDQDDLSILQSVTPPERSTGRITAGHSDDRDYVYVAGDTSLFRYVYANGHLSLDDGWGPVTYRSGLQTPGTGPGILGDYVVVQSNFLPTVAPLTVTAASVHDSRRTFSITPFPDSHASWNVSKMALDTDNQMIVTNDTLAEQMAGVHLDPEHGLEIRWRRSETTLAFSALVGGPGDRNIVVPDFVSGVGDRTIWIDEATGRTLATSRVLAASPAPGNIVLPGFGGRFYYLSSTGALWELSPQSIQGPAPGQERLPRWRIRQHATR